MSQSRRLLLPLVLATMATQASIVVLAAFEAPARAPSASISCERSRGA